MEQLTNDSPGLNRWRQMRSAAFGLCSASLLSLACTSTDNADSDSNTAASASEKGSVSAGPSASSAASIAVSAGPAASTSSAASVVLSAKPPAPACADIPTLAFGDKFTVTSKAFEYCKPIPTESTCEGKPFPESVAPEVTWTEGPKETKSYAVVFKDLAIIATADPGEMRYNQGFHWVLWNIPPETRSIPAKLMSGHKVTEISGALQWAPFQNYGFMGPCPNMPPAEGMTAPPRNNDSYSFTVYAFSTPTVSIPAVPMGKSFPRAMDEYLKSIAIAAAEYRGTSDARASIVQEGTLPSKAVMPCPSDGTAPEGCLKP